MKKLSYLLLGAGATGLFTFTGALVHAHSYKLRRRSVLVPHPDRSSAPALRILHVSDTHLLVSNKKRRDFLRSLAETRPDFVICTGDFIAEEDAIDAILSDLNALLEVPGAFVFGSNDYHAPAPRNPLRYLFGHTGKPADEARSTTATPSLSTDKLRSGLTAAGWVDLNNRRETITVGAWTLDLVGVDDPHIGLDKMPTAHRPNAKGAAAMPTATAGRSATAGPSAVVEHSTAVGQPATGQPATGQRATAGAPDPYRVRIGVAHAPYVRILDGFVDDGAQMIFAGHTHGGQIALPAIGSLVTNCDLPRQYAHGMFAWPPDTEVITGDGAIFGWDAGVSAGDGRAIVHLSAGIGTSPFTPIRTFCAPEAIQVDVIPL